MYIIAHTLHLLFLTRINLVASSSNSVSNTTGTIASSVDAIVTISIGIDSIPASVDSVSFSIGSVSTRADHVPCEIHVVVCAVMQARVRLAYLAFQRGREEPRVLRRRVLEPEQRCAFCSLNCRQQEDFFCPFGYRCFEGGCIRNSATNVRIDCSGESRAGIYTHHPSSTSALMCGLNGRLQFRLVPFVTETKLMRAHWIRW